MSNDYPHKEKLRSSGNKFGDISAIDARLTELEQEKQQLLALREELQRPKPLVLENPPQQVIITLANHVYFEIKALPRALSARLRRLASFSNPPAL